MKQARMFLLLVFLLLACPTQAFGDHKAGWKEKDYHLNGEAMPGYAYVVADYQGASPVPATKDKEEVGTFSVLKVLHGDLEKLDSVMSRIAERNSGRKIPYKRIQLGKAAANQKGRLAPGLDSATLKLPLAWISTATCAPVPIAIKMPPSGARLLIAVGSYSWHYDYYSEANEKKLEEALANVSNNMNLADPLFVNDKILETMKKTTAE